MPELALALLVGRPNHIYHKSLQVDQQTIITWYCQIAKWINNSIQWIAMPSLAQSAGEFISLSITNSLIPQLNNQSKRKIITLNQDNRIRVWEFNSGLCIHVSQKWMFNTKMEHMVAVNRFCFTGSTSQIWVVDLWRMEVINKIMFKQTQKIIKVELTDNNKLKVYNKFYCGILSIHQFNKEQFQSVKLIQKSIEQLKLVKLVFDSVQTYDQDLNSEQPVQVPKVSDSSILASNIFSKEFLKQNYAHLRNILSEQIESSYLSFLVQWQLFYFVGTKQGNVYGFNFIHNQNSIYKILYIECKSKVKYMGIFRNNLIVSVGDGRLMIYNLSNSNSSKNQNPLSKFCLIPLKQVYCLRLSMPIKYTIPTLFHCDNKTYEQFQSFVLMNKQIAIYNMQNKSITKIVGMQRNTKLYAVLVMPKGYFGICNQNGIDIWTNQFQRQINYQGFNFIPYHKQIQIMKSNHTFNAYKNKTKSTDIIGFVSRHWFQQINLFKQSMKDFSIDLVYQSLGNIKESKLNGKQKCQLFQFIYRQSQQIFTSNHHTGLVTLKLRSNDTKEQSYSSLRYLIYCDVKTMCDSVENNQKLKLNYNQLFGRQEKPLKRCLNGQICLMGIAGSLTIYLNSEQNPTLQTLKSLSQINYLLAHSNKQLASKIYNILQEYGKTKKGLFDLWVLTEYGFDDSLNLTNSTSNLLMSLFLNMPELWDLYDLKNHTEQYSKGIETQIKILILNLYKYFFGKSEDYQFMSYIVSRILQIFNSNYYHTCPLHVAFLMKVLGQGIINFQHFKKYHGDFLMSLFLMFFNIYVVDEKDGKKEPIQDQNERIRKRMKSFIVKLIFQISIVSTQEFLNLIKKSLQPNPPPAHHLYHNSILQILRHILKHHKQQNFPYLNFFIEQIIKCLDPTYPNIRKWSQGGVTKILWVLNQYKIVDFHQGTQKLAVVHGSWILVYDLRAAVKYRTIDAEGSSIIKFSKSGKFLAAFIESHRQIKIWKIINSGIWGGLLGGQGKQIKRLQIQKFREEQDWQLRWDQKDKEITLLSKNQAINYTL